MEQFRYKIKILGISIFLQGYEGDRDSASTLGGSSMTRSFSGSLSNLNNSTMMSMGGSPRRKGSRAVQQGMEMPIFDGPSMISLITTFDCYDCFLSKKFMFPMFVQKCFFFTQIFTFCFRIVGIKRDFVALGVI